MALTALAALSVGAARAWHAGTLEPRTVPLLLGYFAWTLAGVFGLISLVQGADSLLVSRQRLGWREFLGTVVAVVVAGAFAISCINRPSSGAFLLALYFAPPVIGVWMLGLHFYYLFRRPRLDFNSPGMTPRQPSTSTTSTSDRSR